MSKHDQSAFARAEHVVTPVAPQSVGQENAAQDSAAPRATPRDASGRFAGAGAFTSSTSAPAPCFEDTGTVSDSLAAVIEGTLQRITATGPVPAGAEPEVLVIKLSAGGGKSRVLRGTAARFMPDMNGDLAYVTPTLSLADEAAQHAAEHGAATQVIRGRSALNPADGDRPMCEKSDLAERLGRLGLPIGPSLCRREDQETGEISLCEHHDTCAYMKQFAEISGEPHLICLPHAHLESGHPVDRPVAVRVIDEAFSRSMLRSGTIRVDEFTAPRVPRTEGLDAKRARELRRLARRTQQEAERIVAALRRGEAPVWCHLTNPYGYYEDVEEACSESGIAFVPGESRAATEAKLSRAEGQARLSWRRQRIWRILGENVAAGRHTCERLVLRSGAGEGGADLIEFFWKKDAPKDAPVILLDADADPLITRQFYPTAQFVEMRLRPNARVFQVHDHTMSRRALEGAPGMRRDWTAVIRREVLLDAAGPKGGVLVGCSRKVAKLFFEDAGFTFEGMDENAISRVMLDTKLHGAHWLWFGGRALGSNRWRDCSSVIVIGREELPVEVLEGQARSLFGDTTEDGLQFLEPDEDVAAGCACEHARCRMARPSR